MKNKKIEAAINQQINAEYFSAYIYLAMSAYCEDLGLSGCANWFRVQHQEELSHAYKFIDYLHERGGRVKLSTIEEPIFAWESILHVFQETLKHEEYVTSLINALVDLAIVEKDHATNNFLQWFVAEQVEEEANANEIIQKLELMGATKNNLFLLDKELSSRVFVDNTNN